MGVLYIKTIPFTLGANERKEVEKIVPRAGERITIKKFNFTTSGAATLEIWVENDKRVELDSDFKEDINYGVNVEIPLGPGEECTFVFVDKSGTSNSGKLVIYYERSTA